MIVHNCGKNDQNDSTKPINDYKGEDETMGNKIQDLMNEVEIYKQAIQDAKDALASAEMELDAALDMEFNEQQ